MGYAATECVEDGIEATKAFLLPVERGRWLRMAVIVFFMSLGAGAGSAPNLGGQFALGDGGFSVEPPDGGPPWEWSLSSIPDGVWLLLGGLVVAVLALLLVFGFVGAVMEFVLVEALQTEEASVRAPFRRYLGAGLSLFVFQVALLLLLIALPVGALGYFVILPAVTGGAGTASLVGLALLLVLLFVLLALTAAVVNGFTVAFVVPVMLREGCGVLDGWRRFWPTLRGNLGEFTVYIVLRWVIAIAVSFVAGTVTTIVGGLLVGPLLLFGSGVFFGTGGALTPATVAASVLLGVLVFLLLVALSTVVQVPLKTFTRYYELLVLGDLEPDFDLVAERREAIRTPDFRDGDGDEQPAG